MVCGVSFAMGGRTAADAALEGAKEEDLSWTRLTVKCTSGLNSLQVKVA